MSLLPKLTLTLPNKEVDEAGREGVAGPTVSLQPAHYTDRTAYVQNPKGVHARKI